MGSEFRSEKLEQILVLVDRGILPTPAKEWALSALNTAEAIQATIESMHSNGVEAPTEAQSRALENIYLAACRWLGDLSVETLPNTAKIAPRKEPKKLTAEQEERRKHHEYLERCTFTKHSKYIGFSGDDDELLRRYGYWLEALQTGAVSPITDSQKAFLSVVQKKEEPKSKFERVWLKYMYAVEMSDALFVNARTLQEMKAKDPNIKYTDIVAAYRSAADMGSMPAKLWLDEQKSPWIKPNSIWLRADSFSGGQVNNLYIEEINSKSQEPF